VLRIVSDQIGSPTWSRMVAEVTAQIVAQGISDISGYIEQHKRIYNLIASDSTSWCGFVNAIVDNSDETLICKNIASITK